MEALVEKIKQIQRTTAQGKQAWIQYCDEHLEKVHDPNRHDPETLQGFLDSFVSDMELPDKDLIGKLKALQRSSPEGKQAWLEHCDTDLGGVRDPSRHDASVLREFLAWWESEGGEVPEPGVDRAPAFKPPAKLVQRIKTLQRSNPKGKEAWDAYCDAELGGIHDPSRHEESKLTAFFETWAPDLDLTDDSLVGAVKKLQGSSAEGKQAWLEHCDAELGGVRDPARHENSTLQSFLDWWVAEGGELAVAAPTRSAARPRSTPKGQGKAAAAGTTHADFVKLGARLSPQFKVAWVQYCRQWGQSGSDPSKYDEAYLSAFVEHTASLLKADLAGAGEDAATAAAAQKRPASGGQSEQPATKVKLTIKKSIADEIRRLNSDGGLCAPIALGAVAGALAKLDEDVALAVLASVLDAGDVANPSEFICEQAREALGVENF